jgi:hypothetical protein
VKLYWGELIRQHWFLLVVFPLIFLAQSIHILTDSIYIGSCHMLFGLIVFLFLRYRFLSGVRNNPAFHCKWTLTVYPDKLILDDENGSLKILSLTDLEEVKLRKTQYYLKLHSKALFWIPRNIFKTEDDQHIFERLVGVRK